MNNNNQQQKDIQVEQNVQNQQPIVKNYAQKELGAIIYDYSSQYDHGSKVENVISHDPRYCYFTSAFVPLPQYVTIDLNRIIDLKKIAIFLHGENNQNPCEIKISTSQDAQQFIEILHDFVPQQPGIKTWQVQKKNVRFIKYEILENFGGSGSFITQLMAYGIDIKDKINKNQNQ